MTDGFSDVVPASSVGGPELARLLQGGPLAGRQVHLTDNGALAIECDAQEVWPMWQAARDLVPVTGRWPVAVTSWEDDEPAWIQRDNICWRPSQEAWTWPSAEPSELPEPLAMAKAALAVDPWSDATRNRYGVDEPLTPSELADQLRRAGSPLPLDQVQAALGDRPSSRQLERLLLDHRAKGRQLPLPAEERPFGTRSFWFNPSGQPVALAFLPTAHTWQSPAYIDFYGGGGPWLMAAELDWHRHWGAELVAGWGTMLQFTVRRPPTTLKAAWELAGQLLSVGGSLQMRQDELALSVLGGDAWLLHDRP